MTSTTSLPPVDQAGIGLRSAHYGDIIAAAPAVGWYEVHSENYLGGGAPRHYLEMARRDRPVSLHGVGLSLGSAQGIDARHLARIAGLVERIEPALISEHLAWNVMDGTYLAGLLPLPMTEEALAIVARNVDHLQTRLKRRVLIENPSAYLAFVGRAIPEAEFLNALARMTGCGILCDVNNIYVTCHNLGGDPDADLAALDARHVGELHLAGHQANSADGLTILIDDHGSAVSEPVWRLYEAAAARFPQAPTLIEWDSRIPPLATLVEEARRADMRRREALAKEVPHAA